MSLGQITSITINGQQLSAVQPDRVRIYWMEERLFLTMLEAGRELPDYLHFPKFNLPPTAEIVRIEYAWNRRAFGVMLRDPSFDPVSPGSEVPWVDQLSVQTFPMNFVRGDHVSFKGLNRDELLRIRDDLNAALYDLDKRPMG